MNFLQLFQKIVGNNGGKEKIIRIYCTHYCLTALMKKVNKTLKILELEDIGRKNIDLYVFLLPRVRRKACLLASMFQKGLAVPSIFCRNLR